MQELINMGSNSKILELLAGKSSTKQLVFRETKAVFDELKSLLKEIATELNDSICSIDKSVVVEFFDRGTYEAEIKFSGDTLIFHMHTNTFSFEKNHHVHKTQYVKKNHSNGYFGMINVYNFLSDSLYYNRVNDYGLLLGRLFVNKERHFFVEGRRQLAFAFNDLEKQTVSKEALRRVVEVAIIQAIEFDLTAPDMNQASVVSVSDIRSISNDLKISTSKKLGFKMSYRLDKKNEKKD